MNRRLDHTTAEVIEIVLLTQAAFGPHAARRYVEIANLEPYPVYEVLARPRNQVRKAPLLGFSGSANGRRLRDRN